MPADPRFEASESCRRGPVIAREPSSQRTVADFAKGCGCANRAIAVDCVAHQGFDLPQDNLSLTGVWVDALAPPRRVKRPECGRLGLALRGRHLAALCPYQLALLFGHRDLACAAPVKQPDYSQRFSSGMDATPFWRSGVRDAGLRRLALGAAFAFGGRSQRIDELFVARKKILNAFAFGTERGGAIGFVHCEVEPLVSLE